MGIVDNKLLEKLDVNSLPKVEGIPLIFNYNTNIRENTGRMRQVDPEIS